MSGPSLTLVLAAIEASGKRHWHRGNHIQAQCPAHEDREPSLSIDWKAGRVLVCCQGACSTRDVLAALNLSFADLFDEPRPDAHGWVPRPRRPPPPDPMERLKKVFGKSVRMINAKAAQRHWRRWSVPWPQLSAEERVELAEWGEKQDQDRHYWRVVARKHFEEKASHDEG